MKPKQSQKKLYLAYVLSLFIGLVLASCVIDPHDNDGRHNDFVATEDFNFKIDIRDQRRLELFGVNGTVEIYGTSQTLDVVEIRGEMRVESDSRRDAEDYLRDLSVEISNQSDRLIVRTQQPNDTRGRNFVVNYHICIPGDWRVLADNTNGVVRVDSVGNDVAVYQSNGEINLGTITGDVNVDLTNGNLFFRDVYGNLDAENVNGNIDARVTIPSNGKIRMGTVNGNLLLSIPANTAADFSATATNGGISVSNLFLHNSQITNRSTTGTLGNGDGEVTLGTVNGAIQVTGF